MAKHTAMGDGGQAIGGGSNPGRPMSVIDGPSHLGFVLELQDPQPLGLSKIHIRRQHAN